MNTVTSTLTLTLPLEIFQRLPRDRGELVEIIEGYYRGTAAVDNTLWSRLHTLAEREGRPVCEVVADALWEKALQGETVAFERAVEGL